MGKSNSDNKIVLFRPPQVGKDIFFGKASENDILNNAQDEHLDFFDFIRFLLDTYESLIKAFEDCEEVLRIAKAKKLHQKKKQAEKHLEACKETERCIFAALSSILDIFDDEEGSSANENELAEYLHQIILDQILAHDKVMRLCDEIGKMTDEAEDRLDYNKDDDVFLLKAEENERDEIQKAIEAFHSVDLLSAITNDRPEDAERWASIAKIQVIEYIYDIMGSFC